MKKRYTKRQIQESIAYWKKQLKVGNYRKLNEAVTHKYDFTFNIKRGSDALDGQPRSMIAYGKDQEEAWEKVLQQYPDATLIDVETNSYGDLDDEDGLVDYVKEVKFFNYTTDAYLYITELNDSFNTPIRKIGASHGSRKNQENPETLRKKLTRYSTCVPQRWSPMYQILLDDSDASKLFSCEEELFNYLSSDRIEPKELFTSDDNAVQDALRKFKQNHPTAKIIRYPKNMSQLQFS